MNTEERIRVDGVADGLSMALIMARGQKSPQRIRAKIEMVLNLALEVKGRDEYRQLLEATGRPSHSE